MRKLILVVITVGAACSGGPNNSLTLKPNAFPPLASYNDSDFGTETAVLDINFDGLPDIVTFGTVYSWNSVKRAPTAVWINNGNGTFQLRHFADEIEGAITCGDASQPKFNEAYFLKTSDPKAFDLVIAGCQTGAAGPAYFTRRVTPAFPLPLVP